MIYLNEIIFSNCDDRKKTLHNMNNINVARIFFSS